MLPFTPAPKVRLTHTANFSPTLFLNSHPTNLPLPYISGSVTSTDIRRPSKIISTSTVRCILTYLSTTFITCNGNEKYRVTSNFGRDHFAHLSELKIMARLEFEVIFFTLRKFRKHNFPRRTSDLAKTSSGFYGKRNGRASKSYRLAQKILECKTTDATS